MKICFASRLMSGRGYGVMSMKYVRKDGKVEFLNAGVSAGQEAVNTLFNYSRIARPTNVNGTIVEFVIPDGKRVELVRKNGFHKDIFFISSSANDLADQIIVPSIEMFRDTRKKFFAAKEAFLKLAHGQNS